MNLRCFLRTQTSAQELCAIYDSGYLVAMCFIDYEDLFHIPPKLSDKPVLKDGWDYLDIVDKNGDRHKIPCHKISV